VTFIPPVDPATRLGLGLGDGIGVALVGAGAIDALGDEMLEAGGR